jgi:hypothetical protein
MPSTIPFDSGLVLGNIVDPNQIKLLNTIAQQQEPVNEAEEKLNALITSKHKLDMTMQEMINSNVPKGALGKFAESITKTEEGLTQAATEYGAAVLKQQPLIQKAKSDAHKAGGTIQSHPESPIDWEKSQIKKLALSSDTMITDAQFIRNENEDDYSGAHAEATATAASGSVKYIFGPKISASVARSVKSSTLAQTSKHKIAGTLVITATCTHKISEVFAPFVMDPIKAVTAWNALMPDKMNSPEEITAAASVPAKAGEVLSLLSGQTVGSSFVGMVHVLQVEETKSAQSSAAVSAQAKAVLEFGAFYAHGKGEFGSDAEFSNSVKSMLSNSELSSHCSLVTMGLIPSLKSNQVKTSISQLKPSASEVMEQLGAIQGSTSSTVNSISSDANAAKAGAQAISLNNSYITGVVSNLSTVDNDNNKIIDVNSLMTAFDDYVVKAAAGDCGIPINFFIKEVTKPDIAKSWLHKFSPQENWQNNASGGEGGEATVKDK